MSATALEIDEIQAKIVKTFLDTPLLFGYDTDNPIIGNIIIACQEIEVQLKKYVELFYAVNAEYATKSSAPIDLAIKYKMFDKFAIDVITPFVQNLQSAVDNITEYQLPVQPMTPNLAISFLDELIANNMFVELCNNLKSINTILTQQYNVIVDSVMNILGERSSLGSMDVVEGSVPEYVSEIGHTPFRSMEKIREKLKHRREKLRHQHLTAETSELVGLFREFKRSLLDKFVPIHKYILAQLSNIVYVKSRKRGGAKKSHQRRTNKRNKTIRRRKH
jgi:hypothetical protein